MGTTRRNRVKMSVTVAPELVREMDEYIEQHPGADRSKIIDRGLRLWFAEALGEALEAQYAAPMTEQEKQEHADWDLIVEANTRLLLKRWNETEE